MTKTVPQDDSAEPIVGYKVKLDWRVPDSITNAFATNSIIQHDSDAFTFSFFSMQRPFVFGEHDAVRQQMDNIKSVETRCVAQITITPQHARNLLKALEDNIRKYDAQFDQTSSTANDTEND